MSLFFRRPDRVKVCYTRKFGNFRSSGNQKKEGCICLCPVLRTPTCSLTIVTSYIHQYRSCMLLGTTSKGRFKKKKRVRTDTKCRFTDRHRKEIGTYSCRYIDSTRVHVLNFSRYQNQLVVHGAWWNFGGPRVALSTSRFRATLCTVFLAEKNHVFELLAFYE
jgi:hypothetical protein